MEERSPIYQDDPSPSRTCAEGPELSSLSKPENSRHAPISPCRASSRQLICLENGRKRSPIAKFDALSPRADIMHNSVLIPTNHAPSPVNDAQGVEKSDAYITAITSSRKRKEQKSTAHQKQSCKLRRQSSPKGCPTLLLPPIMAKEMGSNNTGSLRQSSTNEYGLVGKYFYEKVSSGSGAGESNRNTTNDEEPSDKLSEQRRRLQLDVINAIVHVLRRICSMNKRYVQHARDRALADIHEAVQTHISLPAEQDDRYGPDADPPSLPSSKHAGQYSPPMPMPQPVPSYGPFHDGTSGLFYCAASPAVTLEQYVARFVKHLRVSISVYVVAFYYLDKVRAKDELLALNELNVHRLFVAAVLVSAKYMEDDTYKNSSLARIGGIPSSAEMNMLEGQFLRRLKWDCGVSPQDYKRYYGIVFRLKRQPKGESQPVRTTPTCKEGRS